MAINETGAIFKGFTFDGIDSKDYGVYISGDAVFNAPERDVEMIDIPGRNGSYALDKGRFANITVTYPAGLFGDTEADFAQGISDLRNALASRKGYCRLEDEYNPNEYRMAIYRSGLDVEPASLKSGEFDIVFDCKPQRFLKSGETAVEVTSGGTINNPTLFESKPLLQVWGYGDIGVNGETITVQNVPIGELTIARNEARAGRVNGTSSVVNVSATIAEGVLATGDPFTVKAQGSTSVCNALLESNLQTVDSVSYRTVQTSINIQKLPHYADSFANQTAIFEPVSFVYGTSKTAYCSVEVTATAHETATPSNSLDYSFTMNFRLEYDGQNTLTLRETITNASTALSGNMGVSYNAIVGVSSKSSLGSPLYIDLDIGEAYKEEDGVLISSNTGVILPPELPTLKQGANEIQTANTITQLEIVPRWWEV